jgi:hypothetical protein
MEFPDTQGLTSVGWRGFLDTPYLIQSLAALLLATALGTLIAFHPTTSRMVDTLEEAELPKVHVIYALIGAMVGVIVLEYGLVVGFVVFGLGGLIRFRTTTATTRDTGRLIVVTLIGLICGLNLPHFAVLAALYAWGLIFLFDRRPVFSLDVRQIADGRTKDASAAYHQALKGIGCKIISEGMSPAKGRVDFLLRAPRASSHGTLQAALAERVPAELRGELRWKVE